MALQTSLPVDRIAGVEFLAVFLLFVGIVFLSGLVYAWRYRRMERRQRQGSSAEPKAQRTVEPVVMLSAIENLGAVDEMDAPLQIDLQDELPPSAAVTGPVATQAPPTDEAH